MSLYEALLHLYPKSFRLEYGAEMRRLFEKRLSATDSAPGVIGLWLSSLRDVMWNAALLHADILRQDLRFAARSLRRSPGFTVTVVLVASLGVAATTAAFSVTDRVLIRSLPFRDSDRLVKLYQSDAGYPRFEPAPAHYRDWKSMSVSFEDVGAYAVTPANLVVGDEPRRVTGAAMTANLLHLLDVSPAVGRSFTAEDNAEGASGTVILSHGLWVEAFGESTAAIGETIRLDDETYSIVGVMPRAFAFPDRSTRLWTSLRLKSTAFADRDDHYLHLVARLKPGVTLETSRADMRLVNQRLKAQYAAENDVTVALLSDQVPQQSRQLLVALLGAALCVLLIACTNLGSLLIARSLQRGREFAVRTAIGAGRERLIRQLSTESLVLAGLGGGLGIALAYAATPLLARLTPASLPFADAAALDGRILAFATLMALFTGIAFGVVPALALNRDHGAGGLREGSRGGIGGRRRVRSVLVFTEIALSMVLLVSCGLLVRALWKVQSTDPGFKARNVLVARTALPMPRYESAETRGRFYDQVLMGLRALPGVKTASYTSFLPMVMRGGIGTVEIPGRTTGRAGDHASMRFVTSSYFETLGITMVAGRDFNQFDTKAAPPVVVVSSSFANRYWPNEDAIGRVVTIASAERQIVGVVADVRVRGLERTSEPQIYLSHLQIGDGFDPFYAPKDLALRVEGDPASVAGALRDVVRRVDPTIAVSDMRPMEAIVEAETASRSVQLTILQGFAAVATVLAAIGLHGLIAFSVSNRLREIGLRMALGAARRDILRLVLDDGLRLAAWGVLFGIALAYAAGRSMSALLAGLDPLDAPAFLTATIVVALMTAGGSLLPALRALRVNPTSVMRSE